MAAIFRGGMMTPVWGTALLVLAAVTGSHCFSCFVCLPAVAGTQAEMDKAMQVRAAIVRTWPSIAEGQMGDCTAMSRAAKFMLECPTDDALTACSKISALSGVWSAHSCGVITKTRGIGCDVVDGTNNCMCASPLCNSPATCSAPIASTVALLAALLVARALVQ